MSANYLVISSDGHAGPPADIYREYLDPAFRSAFDRHQEELVYEFAHFTKRSYK